MKTRELRTELKNFKEIRRYIVDILREENAGKRAISETMLVFEAVYNDMLEQGVPEDTDFRVQAVNSFGELKIRMGFEGELYIPLSEQRDRLSAEDAVMRAYGEKIDHFFHGGYNNIIISVRRSFERALVFCLMSVVFALLVYAVLKTFMGVKQQNLLLDNLVFPLEKLFANAMLMIGAPVTFFSLLKNLTDSYVISERNSDIRRIHYRTLTSSVASVIMAIGMSLALYEIIKMVAGGEIGDLDMSVKTSFAGIIESIIPSNIFEPFETAAPFPLIVLAILVTYALCSAGKYFGSMREAIDACYTMFSRMLTVVMFALPFFCFLAVLDLLLDSGLIWLVYMIIVILMIFLSLSVLALFYALRLKRAGVPIAPFVRTLIPLMKENLKINSSIDAVPFNIRYCATKYGMDRKMLESSLPVLAQLNLDGNCFLITLTSLLAIFVNGTSASWFDIIVIGILVLFMSMGAPNQPGSIAIGLLIIANYVGSEDMVTMSIYAELILGSILTLTNTIGDIVIVAVEDSERKKQRHS